MRLSRQEVAHVAELAKLGLREEEIERFSEQLSAILEYMQMLNQLDTEAIPPTAHILGLENRMREDAATFSYPLEDILQNAPATENGSFKVKLILE